MPWNPPREIAEPYVCIAVKSTNRAKMWNNGHGWNQVIGTIERLRRERGLIAPKERS